MKPEKYLILVVCALELVKCNVVPASDSPMLMKILDVVDLATSDQHLFDATLQLLKGLCMCMRETLKTKEDKLITDYDSNLLLSEDHSNNERKLNIYREIYNKTCFDLRNEIATECQRQHNASNDPSMDKSYKIHNIYEKKFLRENVKHDINSYFDKLMYKTLIESKKLHKYSIQRSNLKIKPLMTGNNITQQNMIIIITLSQNVRMKQSEKPEEFDFEYIREIIASNNTDVAIEIFNTIYHDVNLVTNSRVVNVTSCNLLSLYTFLMEKKKNNQINLFKLLNKNDDNKMYVDLVADISEIHFLNVCCNNTQQCEKKLPKIYYDLQKSVKDNHHMIQNYKETIVRIKNLVKLYDEKIKRQIKNSTRDSECIGTTEEIYESDNNTLRIILNTLKNKTTNISSDKFVDWFKYKYQTPLSDITTDDTTTRLETSLENEFDKTLSSPVTSLRLQPRDLNSQSQQRDTDTEKGNDLSILDSVDENNWIGSNNKQNSSKKLISEQNSSKKINLKIRKDLTKTPMHKNNSKNDYKKLNKYKINRLYNETINLIEDNIKYNTIPTDYKITKSKLHNILKLGKEKTSSLESPMMNLNHFTERNVLSTEFTVVRNSNESVNTISIAKNAFGGNEILAHADKTAKILLLNDKPHITSVSIDMLTKHMNHKYTTTKNANQKNITSTKPLPLRGSTEKSLLFLTPSNLLIDTFQDKTVHQFKQEKPRNLLKHKDTTTNKEHVLTTLAQMRSPSENNQGDNIGTLQTDTASIKNKFVPMSFTEKSIRKFPKLDNKVLKMTTISNKSNVYEEDTAKEIVYSPEKHTVEKIEFTTKNYDFMVTKSLRMSPTKRPIKTLISLSKNFAQKSNHNAFLNFLATEMPLNIYTVNPSVEIVTEKPLVTLNITKVEELSSLTTKLVDRNNTSTLATGQTKILNKTLKLPKIESISKLTQLTENTLKIPLVSKLSNLKSKLGLGNNLGSSSTSVYLNIQENKTAIYLAATLDDKQSSPLDVENFQPKFNLKGTSLDEVPSSPYNYKWTLLGIDETTPITGKTMSILSSNFTQEMPVSFISNGINESGDTSSGFKSKKNNKLLTWHNTTKSLSRTTKSILKKQFTATHVKNNRPSTKATKNKSESKLTTSSDKYSIKQLNKTTELPPNFTPKKGGLKHDKSKHYLSSTSQLPTLLILAENVFKITKTHAVKNLSAINHGMLNIISNKSDAENSKNSRLNQHYNVSENVSFQKPIESAQKHKNSSKIYSNEIAYKFKGVNTTNQSLYDPVENILRGTNLGILEKFDIYKSMKKSGNYKLKDSKRNDFTKLGSLADFTYNTSNVTLSNFVFGTDYPSLKSSTVPIISSKPHLYTNYANSLNNGTNLENISISNLNRKIVFIPSPTLIPSSKEKKIIPKRKLIVKMTTIPLHAILTLPKTTSLPYTTKSFSFSTDLPTFLSLQPSASKLTTLRFPNLTNNDSKPFHDNIINSVNLDKSKTVSPISTLNTLIPISENINSVLVTNVVPLSTIETRKTKLKKESAKISNIGTFMSLSVLPISDGNITSTDFIITNNSNETKKHLTTGTVRDTVNNISNLDQLQYVETTTIPTTYKPLNRTSKLHANEHLITTTLYSDQNIGLETMTQVVKTKFRENNKILPIAETTTNNSMNKVIGLIENPQINSIKNKEIISYSILPVNAPVITTRPEITTNSLTPNSSKVFYKKLGFSTSPLISNIESTGHTIDLPNLPKVFRITTPIINFKSFFDTKTFRFENSYHEDYQTKPLLKTTEKFLNQDAYIILTDKPDITYYSTNLSSILPKPFPEDIITTQKYVTTYSRNLLTTLPNHKRFTTNDENQTRNPIKNLKITSSPIEHYVNVTELTEKKIINVNNSKNNIINDNFPTLTTTHTLNYNAHTTIYNAHSASVANINKDNLKTIINNKRAITSQLESTTPLITTINKISNIYKDLNIVDHLELIKKVTSTIDRTAKTLEKSTIPYDGTKSEEAWIKNSLIWNKPISIENVNTLKVTSPNKMKITESVPGFTKKLHNLKTNFTKKMSLTNQNLSNTPPNQIKVSLTATGKPKYAKISNFGQVSTENHIFTANKTFTLPKRRKLYQPSYQTLPNQLTWWSAASVSPLNKKFKFSSRQKHSTELTVNNKVDNYTLTPLLFITDNATGSINKNPVTTSSLARLSISKIRSFDTPRRFVTEITLDPKMSTSKNFTFDAYNNVENVTGLILNLNNNIFEENNNLNLEDRNYVKNNSRATPRTENNVNVKMRTESIPQWSYENATERRLATEIIKIPQNILNIADPITTEKNLIRLKISQTNVTSTVTNTPHINFGITIPVKYKITPTKITNSAKNKTSMINANLTDTLNDNSFEKPTHIKKITFNQTSATKRYTLIPPQVIEDLRHSNFIDINTLTTTATNIINNVSSSTISFLSQISPLHITESDYKPNITTTSTENHTEILVNFTNYISNKETTNSNKTSSKDNISSNDSTSHTSMTELQSSNEILESKENITNPTSNKIKSIIDFTKYITRQNNLSLANDTGTTTNVTRSNLKLSEKNNSENNVVPTQKIINATENVLKLALENLTKIQIPKDSKLSTTTPSKIKINSSHISKTTTTENNLETSIGSDKDVYAKTSSIKQNATERTKLNSTSWSATHISNNVPILTTIHAPRISLNFHKKSILNATLPSDLSLKNITNNTPETLFVNISSKISEPNTKYISGFSFGKKISSQNSITENNQKNNSNKKLESFLRDEEKIYQIINNNTNTETTISNLYLQNMSNIVEYEDFQSDDNESLKKNITFLSNVEKSLQSKLKMASPSTYRIDPHFLIKSIKYHETTTKPILSLDTSNIFQINRNSIVKTTTKSKADSNLFHVPNFIAKNRVPETLAPKSGLSNFTDKSLTKATMHHDVDESTLKNIGMNKRIVLNLSHLSQMLKSGSKIFSDIKNMAYEKYKTTQDIHRKPKKKMKNKLFRNFTSRRPIVKPIHLVPIIQNQISIQNQHNTVKFKYPYNKYSNHLYDVRQTTMNTNVNSRIETDIGGVIRDGSFFERLTLPPVGKERTVKYNTYQPTHFDDFDVSRSLEEEHGNRLRKYQSRNNERTKIVHNPEKYIKSTRQSDYLFFTQPTKSLQTTESPPLEYKSTKNTFTTVTTEKFKPNGLIKRPKPVKIIPEFHKMKSLVVSKNYKKKKNTQYWADSPITKTIMYPVTPPKRFVEIKKRLEAPHQYLFSYRHREKTKPHWTPQRMQIPAPPTYNHKILKPFESYDSGVSPRTYFRAKPLVIQNPRDEEFYKADKDDFTERERSSFLLDTLHMPEEKIGSVLDNPGAFIPPVINKPKFLRDRVDSIRSFIATYPKPSTKPLFWKDSLPHSKEDSDDDMIIEPSMFFYQRRNLQETTTSKKKKKRGRRTIFFLSPTVPYNRYF